jgi:NDP-sugar pyrophosphorylase family protein
MPELLNIGKRIGLKIGLFPIHEYWTDVGRPADLEAAENVHRLDPSA